MKVTDIRSALKARGMTHAQLARHLGVSRVHVTQLLSGKRRMSHDMMQAIEALLAGPWNLEAAGVAETRAPFEHRQLVRSVTLDEAKAQRGKRRVRMSEEDRQLWIRQMLELGEAGRRLPRVTDMTDDEILGYDEMP